MENAESRNNNNRKPVTVIPVHEEHISIGKETIETAKVTIQTTVEERVETVNIPIQNETVNIERIAVNKVYDSPPASVRFEGDTTIISVIKEVSVVVKKYEVIEELHISKLQTETPLTQEVSLRKEKVTVTRNQLNDQ
jgi:uncharacterized protein (TIGR02271 family)